MEITVKRIYYCELYTVGALRINGKYFCDTLELHCIDWSKEKKVAGKTAIPEGRYEVELSYSPTFRRKMPHLKNVPHFTGILIHTGNWAGGYLGHKSDTRGCILVGINNIVGGLSSSRIYFQDLYKRIEEAVSVKEKVWVEVK